jgi:DNA-binding response OmpR family regulator
MKLPYRVLVLDDDPHALDGISELLYEAGYDVTPAASYNDAKKHLAESPYDLLISDVRLRSFNGLHLVMQCRRECPEMALMIMTGYDESMIELEASRYNAAFVRKPIQPTSFLEHVTRALGSVRRERRWPRKEIAGGFRVLAAGRQAAVVDVSYGGLRLKVPAATEIPAAFEIAVTGIGLELEVQSVWSTVAPEANMLVCGATLVSDSTKAAQTWRTIVDRLAP